MCARTRVPRAGPRGGVLGAWAKKCMRRAHACAGRRRVHRAPCAAQLVKTVVDQAHLRPAIVSEHPVHWSYDHALQLPYTPDALVLADANAFYECTYAGCVAFNPGTLLAEHSWMVYRPGPNSVEFSKL